ncbi:PREDICTED: adult-specific cuticular protein ACP-20-like [Nicrophorus vespilloides]|uniref:Adult-specific cuticular protein ACP-20-like n=1 Tax=Nicrophorus vespilloides TaxID=110193 RepID=A0ABM1NB43_NICVS|nr:PREDICTED: adult-specific cuticular protein ACP-20-like [Nicrophorus vespilloides]XP_017784043.1 PREDICTED: adult-specific cuticular protein ACP-20-like [Nicrophorus vespilloides]XP_017784044.1 PREDICTED: adult-specific cuticular protein ACP-20-like [Nicrophorus vespilloides]XP_017784046.1 PREDICTED: adult-specific cuticular protein ACP-20-like [Nicrophorus vespilloides]XP_017784047.1 PREDICTED: adult-specific cuticular protein ACP-20-like [Nicrophorus vespilloides]XP_017784048.1 PREDICTED:
MSQYLVVVCLIALAVYANAGIIHGGYEGGYESQGLDSGYGGGDSGHGHEDYHDHPKYKFNYAVHDPHTGDEKQHHEERDGDQVKGTYTLKEADGTTRVVEYKADKHNGFNAVVHKLGHPTHGGQGSGHYGGHY